MSPCFSFFQIIPGPPDNDLFAVKNKILKDFFYGKKLRLVVHNRKKDNSEAVLQLCVFVQLIDNHACDLIFFQPECNPHPFPIRFVPYIPDPLEPLVSHQFGNFLDNPRLVYLIRKLCNDNRFSSGSFVFLHNGSGTNPDNAPAVSICVINSPGTVDNTGRGEVRTRNVIQQPFPGNFRVVDDGLYGFNDFKNIVRWNIGGHAHSDARRTVDQKIGDLSRQYGRLCHGFIIIGGEINGLLVQILQHFMGQTHHSDFRIPHGCRWISIHRPEVSLAVYQRIP